ncbi:MAG: hypothetical protein RJQ09_12380 [Cyclobacteriaceae bacterium]
MESFLVFFENMPAWQKLLWVIGCLSFVWLLELVVPLVQHDYKKLRHDGINLVFLSFSLIINLLVGIATVAVFFWISESRVGLLNWIELPIWADY